MKTNVVMTRKMQNFEIKQRTCDGMFNATEFLNQWNGLASNPKRDLSKFWEQENVKAFIEILMKEENLNTPSEGYYKQRGKNGGTWMHPILFLKFAMWINPKFEYFVIKFVHDQLIELRHNAGDNYRSLASAAQNLPSVDFAKIAKALNYVVFGKHEENLRQSASKEQLKELTDLQIKLAFAIDMGYIKSFDELMYELRRLFAKKNRLEYELINRR